MAPGARETQEDNYGITRDAPNHDRGSAARVRRFFERTDGYPFQSQSALSARGLSRAHSGVQAAGVCALAVPPGSPASLRRDHAASGRQDGEWARPLTVQIAQST